MFAFFAYEFLVAQMPMRVIWSERYFDPAWQAFFDLFNSLPLLAVGFVAAWFMRKEGWAILFASAACHALLDLPVHREDGHRHFWPLSDWRFMSPVSYWDPEHGGDLGSLLELVLVAVASVVLWRRYSQRLARGALVLLNGASLLGWLRFYAGRLF
jgi:membrane-bound metal-dependent hydrolase YbcI (DUF457 family)